MAWSVAAMELGRRSLGLGGYEPQDAPPPPYEWGTFGAPPPLVAEDELGHTAMLDLQHYQKLRLQELPFQDECWRHIPHLIFCCGIGKHSGPSHLWFECCNAALRCTCHALWEWERIPLREWLEWAATAQCRRRCQVCGIAQIFQGWAKEGCRQLTGRRSIFESAGRGVP